MINPLDTTFINQTINIMDLMNPLTKMVANKSFTNCRLTGAIAVCITGDSNLEDIQFALCDFVIFRDNASPLTVYRMENCTFNNCSFWECTIFIKEADAPALEEASKRVGLNIIAGYGARKTNLQVVK